MSQSRISELTVEDPAEAFEDLRDRVDLRMLLSHTQFMEEGFNSSGLTASGAGGKIGGVGPGKRAGKTHTPAKGKMSPPADKVWLEKWRKDLKIAGVRAFVLFLYEAAHPGNSDNITVWSRC